MLAKIEAIKICKEIQGHIASGELPDKEAVIKKYPELFMSDGIHKFVFSCPLCQYVEEQRERHSWKYTDGWEYHVFSSYALSCALCPLIEQFGQGCVEKGQNWYFNPIEFAKLVMRLEED